jgi:hypothetical protein
VTNMTCLRNSQGPKPGPSILVNYTPLLPSSYQYSLSLSLWDAPSSWSKTHRHRVTAHSDTPKGTHWGNLVVDTHVANWWAMPTSVGSARRNWRAGLRTASAVYLNRRLGSLLRARLTQLVHVPLGLHRLFEVQTSARILNRNSEEALSFLWLCLVAPHLPRIRSTWSLGWN